MAMIGNPARIWVLLFSLLCATAVEDGVFKKRASRLRASVAHHEEGLIQNKRSVKGKDVDNTADDDVADDDDNSVDDSDIDGADDEPVVVVDDPEQQETKMNASTVVKAKVVVAKAVAAPAVNLQKAGPWNETHVTMTVSDGFHCEYNKDHEYDADVDHPESNVRCAELELLTNDVEDVEQALQKNKHEQQETEVRLTGITDKEVAEVMIRGHEKVVANETQSPGLGMFLGGMWREMRMYAKPFYTDHLKQKQVTLTKEQKQLEVDLDKAKKVVAVLKAKYKAEDKAERARHAVAEVEASGEDSKLDEVKAKADEAEAEAEEAEGKSEELDAKDDSEKREAKKKEAKAKEEEGEAEEREIAAQEKDVAAAKVEPAAKPVPMFTEKTMPAVSPTMYCVICLSWQFFLIYTACEILRTANQVTSNALASVELMVEAMKPSVTYAPMLCVLFLATRIRAIQLTKGQTEKYELPQPWVQACMYGCTAAVAGQAVLVLIVSFLSGAPQTQGQDAAQVDQIAPPKGAKVLSVIYYIVLAVMYGGFLGVCIGAVIMPAPKDLWGDAAPPPSAALLAIMVLAGTFLLVYLGFNICNIIRQVYQTTRFGKTEYLFTKAKASVNLAPMLAILFLASRMRALQLDPDTANQGSWVESCMFVAAGGILITVVVMVIVPRFDKNVEEIRGTWDGEIFFEFRGTRKLVNIVQYGVLAVVYGATFAVMRSIYTIEDPRGDAFTPAVSPAVHCVVILTIVYFLTYTLVFAINSLKEFMMQEQAPAIRQWTGIFDAGVTAVMFAPMLCMLFVGARMRALQLTKTVDGQSPAGAGPQLWVQEAMYLSTWSVILQVLMAYCAAYILGPGNADFLSGDGMQKTGIPTTVGKMLVAFHYVLHICMYGGAVLVIAGVFTMTPETLPPYAAKDGFISGGALPPPPTPAF